MLMPQLQMAGVDFLHRVHAIGCDHEVRCLRSLEPLPATLDLHLDSIACRAIRQLIFRIRHPSEPLIRINVAPSLVLPHEALSSAAVAESSGD